MPLALVLLFGLAGFTAGWLTLPTPAIAILTVAFLTALAAWVKWTYQNPIVSRRVIAIYLVAVAFQFVHMAEEYVGRFPHELVELVGSSRAWPESSFLLVFVFGFGALWVVAAAGALYQVRIANFFIWFYALGAGLTNAISHFVLPFFEGGYFPGLYTAAGHLALSVLLLHALRREAARTGAGDGIARSPAGWDAGAREVLR